MVPGAGTGCHSPAELFEVLSDARTAGFLGPGPIEPHIRHAEGFAVVARGLATKILSRPRLVDLGSGGGLPGLVIAGGWADLQLVLVEANGRRAAFLESAVDRLGLGDRIEVVRERAERLGREEGYRAGFDIAVARSFGPPAVVAECAAPLLRVGGWLIVSEPPDEVTTGHPGRWPHEPLADLGLEVLGITRQGFDYQTLLQRSACPARFPRRDGVPAKRPLF